MWHWYNGRHIDQCNVIESLEINPHIYGEWILTRVPRNFNGERTAFVTKGAGTTWYLHEKNRFEHKLHSVYEN